MRFPPRSSGLLLILAGMAAAHAVAQETVQVGPATGPALVEVPARLEAVRQAVLAAQSGGRIVEVGARSGESVKRGQVLLRIDAPAARAAATAAVAQAAAARAQWDSARADLERARNLHAKQYLSDAALQRAEAQADAVRAQSLAAEAQARAAREIAGWEELRAPYDGWVTGVQAAAGDLAQPGQPLLSVYAPGPMRVTADVADDLRERLSPDQPAHLIFPGGGCSGAPALVKEWTLVPAVDARSRSVGVRVELGNLPQCKPGQLVRLGLPLREAVASIQVPITALVRRGELDAVYVLPEKGAAQLRQVRLGERNADRVTVLAGLERGERVLSNAAHYRPPVGNP